MRRIILSLSMVLAVAMNMQGSDRNPFVAFSINNIDYHIQMSYGNYGTVWASDTKEPYVTGTASIPGNVSYNGVTYIVTGLTYYWPLENGLTKLDIAIGVDSIDDTAFMLSSSLKEVNIPYIKWIGKSAFAHCSIKELNLSSMYLKYIGDGAFSSNKQMTKVTITAQQLKELPDYVFCYCEKLATITINTNITKIGKQAFAFNKAIKTITLPFSLKNMGDEVFYDDNNLKEIKCLATTPPTATSETFSGLNTANLKVIVPVGTVSKYKSATGWKELNITDGTQDVDNVSVQHGTPTKVIENGKVVIRTGENTYTVTGQEVKF